jgi:hypothetical protein
MTPSFNLVLYTEKKFLENFGEILTMFGELILVYMGDKKNYCGNPDYIWGIRDLYFGWFLYSSTKLK